MYRLLKRTRKGNGEYVGFSIVSVMLLIIFTYLIALVQFAFSVHTMNQSLSGISRGVAMCSSLKDAKKMAKNMLKTATPSYAGNIDHMKTNVTLLSKKQKWVNGEYVKVTISGHINTLDPYWTSKTYKKTTIVAIEGGSGSIEAAIEVCRKILYGVENGGQIYGNANYAAIEPPYKNSPNEHFYTIGAGAWYADEAVQLLEQLKLNYPDTFSRYDSGGCLSALLQNKEGFSSLSGTQKSNLVKLLTSPDGRTCQDLFFDSQIKAYFEEGQSRYGITDPGGLIEYMNVKHQGGPGAITRIVGRAEKPITAESMYRSLQQDTADGQVGRYTSRQNCVYQWINTYLK